MNAARSKGLSRGLGELFGSGSSNSGLPQELPVDKLEPGPWQPRQKINSVALSELAQTIAARGILQPIIVRPGDAGNYQIIAGERRWRAAKQAGLRTVPVIVREFSDHDAMLAALVENIQREDLHVLEQARYARRIVKELSLSLKELAPALGMSRPALSNLLRLLELDEEVQELLADDAISTSHARAVAALPRPQQIRVARAISARQLTVRQTEALIQGISKQKPRTGLTSTAVDADTRRLCDELSAKLGMRVEIQPAAKQRGKLVVHYHSLDKLDVILRRLRGK